jgi:hypothetical protein
VLFAAQCFAHKGGPDYGGGSGAVLVGQYAGVMSPTDGTQLNSLGIFTLDVPITGFSTGTMMVFSGGQFFSGPIQGLAQPNGKISAVGSADATVTETIFDSSTETTTSFTYVVAKLDGELSLKIGGNTSSFATLTGTAAFSQYGIDPILGTVTVPLPSLSFIVSGFQQSASPT